MPASEEKDLDFTLRQLVSHEDRQVREQADLLFNILRRIRQLSEDRQVMTRHSLSFTEYYRQESPL